MGTVALRRWKARLICAAAACALIFVSSPALANSLRVEARDSSPTICSATSNTSSCLAIVAVANSHTTQDQISRFLVKLWGINMGSGPPILGLYELQRCSSPGPSPYQITCVLWSSASRHNATLLSQAFKSSQLFQISDITSFGHSTAKAIAEIEIYACLQLSVPPKPGPGASEAISIPDSTLSALSKSGSAALESVARDYLVAARKQSFDAMRSALAKGVAACHRLGLRTSKQFQT
jgi:hypothetical protein